MLERSVSMWQVALAATFALSGLIAGAVLHWFAYHRLARRSARERWGVERVVLPALRGMGVVWLGLLGVRAAVLLLPLRPRVLGAAQDAILVGFLMSAAIVAARIVASLVGIYARRSEGLIASSSIIANLARAVVLGFGALIVLQSLGISITPLLTAFGVGGLAVALALQDTLANVFAGLQVLVSGQVQRGDYVRLASGEDGYVTDITWRNTVIRMLANNTVIVPNSRLASGLVTNFYRPDRELAVLVDVGVAFDCDLGVVERETVAVAAEVLRTVPGGVTGFQPFVRFSGFGEYSIRFTVIMRAREFADQFLIKHEFIKRLHDRYRATGIRIPYPARQVYQPGPTDPWMLARAGDAGPRRQHEH